jgi:type II secretory pathway pseudopilin PulG
MKSRIENMKGRGSDAGFTTMEIVVGLAVIALMSVGAVSLYFTMSGNANENNAQSSGLSVHNAVVSYYSDYGSLPADATDLEDYLGDDASPGDILLATSHLAVYEDSDANAPSATVTVIEDGEAFTDVIVIDRTGNVQKVAGDDFVLADDTTADSSAIVVEWNAPVTTP